MPLNELPGCKLNSSHWWLECTKDLIRNHSPSLPSRHLLPCPGLSTSLNERQDVSIASLDSTNEAQREEFGWMFTGEACFKCLFWRKLVCQWYEPGTLMCWRCFPLRWIMMNSICKDLKGTWTPHADCRPLTLAFTKMQTRFSAELQINTTKNWEFWQVLLSFDPFLQFIFCVAFSVGSEKMLFKTFFFVVCESACVMGLDLSTCDLQTHLIACAIWCWVLKAFVVNC